MIAIRRVVRLILDLLRSVEELHDVRYLGKSHASRLTFCRRNRRGEDQYYGVHIYGLPGRPVRIWDTAATCLKCGAEHNWRDWKKLQLCDGAITSLPGSLPPDEPREQPEDRFCTCGAWLTVDLAVRCWEPVSQRKGRVY